MLGTTSTGRPMAMLTGVGGIVRASCGDGREEPAATSGVANSRIPFACFLWREADVASLALD